MQIVLVDTFTRICHFAFVHFRVWVSGFPFFLVYFNVLVAGLAIKGPTTGKFAPPNSDSSRISCTTWPIVRQMVSKGQKGPSCWHKNSQQSKRDKIVGLSVFYVSMRLNKWEFKGKRRKKRLAETMAFIICRNKNNKYDNIKCNKQSLIKVMVRVKKQKKTQNTIKKAMRSKALLWLFTNSNKAHLFTFF